MIQKEKLIDTVGAANVSFDELVLNDYSGDNSFVNRVRPFCVVKPQTTEIIKQLVLLASATRTPLVPISSGAPHFRGDTVPSIGGAVILDLSDLDNIIRVDRPRRVAMIEAGVTFAELIPAVQKEGLRLNMPLLPRSTKSVIGSILEREPVMMPAYQWDISDPLSCIEVIFGNGEEFRTGQAAGPGTVEEQWAAGAVQKTPYGPGTASLHRLIQGSQGTIGVVTWASLRCELLPLLEEPFLVGSSNLDKLIELVHWLIRLRMVNECFIVNKTTLATFMAQPGVTDYPVIKDLLPPWILFFNVAGYDYYPEEKVSYQIGNITQITRRTGIEAVKEIGGISAYNLLKTIQQPSSDPYWKIRMKGACQEIFFLSIYDKLAHQIIVMNEQAKQFDYPLSDIAVYLQPAVQGTACHCEFILSYRPDNSAEKEKVRDLVNAATKALLANGAFFSRPYGENARTIINRDAAGVAMLTRLKKIFDPNNIMNPGKLCF